MTIPPILFNRAMLKFHRNRTNKNAWFIHDKAIVEIKERLSEIKRDFKKIAIIGFRAESWALDLNLDATCINDDEIINFKENKYDLIIHAMGMHWSNDLLGQLIQMNRALVPDGLIISIFFGGQTLSELRVACAYAESAVSNGISPRIAPMGEIRDLGGLLQRAGFSLPVVDTDLISVVYENPMKLMFDLRGMGEQQAINNCLKKFTNRNVFSRAAEIYKERYANGDGTVTATFEIFFLAAWTPSDNQQQPLKRGTGEISLAEVFK